MDVWQRKSEKEVSTALDGLPKVHNSESTPIRFCNRERNQLVGSKNATETKSNVLLTNATTFIKKFTKKKDQGQKAPRIIQVIVSKETKLSPSLSRDFSFKRALGSMMPQKTRECQESKRSGFFEERKDKEISHLAEIRRSSGHPTSRALSIGENSRGSCNHSPRPFPGTQATQTRRENLACPPFRCISSNNDAMHAAHMFSAQCFMPEVVLFLFAVIEYQDLCKHSPRGEQYTAFQKVTQHFIIVGAPCEINISNKMRKQLIDLMVDQKKFFHLLPRLQNRLEVFHPIYLEMEKLFWSNLYSRDFGKSSAAQELLRFIQNYYNAEMV